MRQETPQEKAYHDMLSPDLGANAHVSFGHQENLRIIQTHLQTFYGQRADWSQCLKAYFQSDRIKPLSVIQSVVKIYLTFL